jgi:hypothetical protein
MSCGTKGGEVQIFSPMKAIRRKCLDCCCGSSQEVSLCHIKDCSLHPYRLGRRPGAVKKEATPAQMERLKRAREARLNGRFSNSPLSGNKEKLAKAKDEG